MAGLLQGNPLLDFGMGLLSASGPSPVPVSLGQAAGYGYQNMRQGERSRLYNELLRNRLIEQKQRQDKINELQNILTGTTTIQGPGRTVTGMGEDIGTIPGQRAQVPTIATPQGQKEVLGLAGELDPDQVITGLLGNFFNEGEAATYRGESGDLFHNLDVARQSGDMEAAQFFESQIRTSLSPDVDFNDLMKTRDNVLRDSKGFLAAQEGFDRVRIGVKDGTPAGDIATIFGFMKTVDPQSVVREGEFATVENSGGVPERIRRLYNSLLTGERLTPEQRTDFLSQAQQQFEARMEQQEKLVDDYRNFAGRRNLPVEDVIPEFIIPSMPDVQTPQGREPGSAMNEAIEETRKLGRDIGINNIASMTLSAIQAIDPGEIKSWSKEKRQALDKRLTELGY